MAKINFICFKLNGQLFLYMKFTIGFNLRKRSLHIKLIEDKKERDGRLKFREALKIHDKCAPAYLYLADSYIREQRLSDAQDELIKFIEQIPELAYLAFERIQDILFEFGQFI